jgi:hypothetical protein
MKLGENSAILGTELTRRTIAYRTRIRVMTPINRVFLKATPMAGSGPILEEAKAPPRTYQIQRRTTSGAGVRA